jgi:hypothetical protein
MTERRWNTDLSGIDPGAVRLTVAVVAGAPATDRLVDRIVATFREWGWGVRVLPAASTRTARAASVGADVVLFYGRGGTRRARRALRALVPTVAVRPPEARAGPVGLLAEAGWRRTTTVTVIHRDREARVLRKVSPAALVRLEPPTADPTYATDLGAVLMRARAWWQP